jgi:hypothetical protein
MLAKLQYAVVRTGGVRNHHHIGLTIDDRRDTFPQEGMVIHAENPDFAFITH